MAEAAAANAHAILRDVLGAGFATSLPQANPVSGRPPSDPAGQSTRLFTTPTEITVEKLAKIRTA